MQDDNPEREEKLGVFAQALLDALAFGGITRDELAQRIDTSASAVTNWTMGRAEPRPTTVFAIETALQLSPGSLSRILGFCPCDTPPVIGFYDVVTNDPKLRREAKSGLLQLYRSLVGA